jgi:FkbM family methyltransferase
VGYFSALMGRYSTNGSVISVEANPDLIKFLEKNVEKYNNVKVFNFAAGNTNGTCDLYLNSLNWQ